eukprot:m.479914 g.479914  ORF g.479914 m.479914 type:complete len:369 (-) comp21632_c0_seq1:51-1157(-)
MPSHNVAGKQKCSLIATKRQSATGNMAWAAPQAQRATPDIQIAVPPSSDSIQCLAWSPNPQMQFLVTGSWDNAVRCWQVAPTGESQAKAEQKLGGPVLDLAWTNDGSKVFAAGCDKTCQMWDMATNQLSPVAAHDAPIKSVRWLDSLQMLMTGSWDKTIRLWDCRTNQPVGAFQLPERCYAMDAKGTLAVAATAGRNIVIYDLNARKEYQRVVSVLKMQTRCIACFNTADGFAIGSIEGRVGIQYVAQQRAQTDNFSFKCHRDDKNVHCVNSLSFHPRFGTFATTGSDGKYIFWDKDNRNRLKAMGSMGAPIPCSGFNADGTLFAYAMSYDWHQGHEGYNPAQPSKLAIHITPDAEIHPKPQGQQQRR